MKHNHRGRVLTVVSQSDKAARRSSQPLLSLPPLNGPSGLPMSMPTATVTQSLQQENEKLKVRLREAERSVENYRSLLQPQRGGLEKRTTATQTTLVQGSTPLQSCTSEINPEKRIEKLEKINVQLVRKMEDLNKTAEDAVAAEKRLRGENSTLTGLLEKNNEMSTQKNEQAATMDSTIEFRENVRRSATLCQEGVDCLKADVADLRAFSDELLGEFHLKFELIRTAVARIPGACCIITPLPCVSDATTSPIRVGAASASTSPMKWPELCDASDEPFPSLPGEAIDNTEEESTADVVKSSEINNSESAVLDRTAIDQTISEGAPPTTPTVLVQKVKLFIEQLSKAHRLEINAVKHTAHCKDLSRLAAQRELTLERDKALTELQHTSEIEDMLTFSVNALERIVSETQPQVVQKLSESRARKTKQIQNSLTSKSRELNQRSGEIGSMNSAHLQSFQTKAQGNQKLREDESAAVVSIFQKELDDMLCSCTTVGRAEGENEIKPDES